MTMEGKGPSEGEDLQLDTSLMAAGDMRISKEVAARCIGELHHVQREMEDVHDLFFNSTFTQRVWENQQITGWTPHQSRGSGVPLGDTEVGAHWSSYEFGQCSGQYGSTVMSVFLRGGKYH